MKAKGTVILPVCYFTCPYGRSRRCPGLCCWVWGWDVHPKVWDHITHLHNTSPSSPGMSAAIILCSCGAPFFTCRGEDSRSTTEMASALSPPLYRPEFEEQGIKMYSAGEKKSGFIPCLLSCTSAHVPHLCPELPSKAVLARKLSVGISRSALRIAKDPKVRL